MAWHRLLPHQALRVRGFRDAAQVRQGHKPRAGNWVDWGIMSQKLSFLFAKKKILSKISSQISKWRKNLFYSKMPNFWLFLSVDLLSRFCCCWPYNIHEECCCWRKQLRRSECGYFIFGPIILPSALDQFSASIFVLFGSLVPMVSFSLSISFLDGPVPEAAAPSVSSFHWRGKIIAVCG